MWKMFEKQRASSGYGYNRQTIEKMIKKAKRDGDEKSAEIYKQILKDFMQEEVKPLAEEIKTYRETI